MRLDNLIIRLTAVLGPEWLQAYTLIDLEPGVDIDAFRKEMPTKLRYHHETEKYLGGVPGDLFVGFFARGQMQLFEEIGKIKALKEVREVKEWAIANFPVATPEMTRLDWRIVKSLRAGAEKSAKGIAAELGEAEDEVAKRLDHIKSIPLAFSIEPPNDNAWKFTEIGLNFYGTTFFERLEDLRKIGKPFGAASSKKQGALMLEPGPLEELEEAVREAASLPGVKVTDIAFCEDMIWSQPWLDDFIDERIREAD